MSWDTKYTIKRNKQLVPYCEIPRKIRNDIFKLFVNHTLTVWDKLSGILW